MLRAVKGNRVLRIPDEKSDEYKSLGYSIQDMEGKIIFKHEDPAEKAADLEKEVNDLKAKLKDAEEYAEKADGKIKDLEKEVNDLKAKVLDLQKSTDEPATPKAKTATEKPAKAEESAEVAK